DGEIESAIQIHIEKHAAKAECVPGCSADTRGNGDVVENSRSGCAIQTDHLVVEISDGDAGFARTIEVAGVNAHAGASFAFRAKGEASFDGDVFEFAVVKIAIKLIGLRVVGDKEVGPAVLVIIQHCHSERF